MGCIQVKLTEDFTTQNVDQILMTSWCSVCHEMTPSIEMSKDTWCLSFAKYLELRFHSHAYKRRVVDINNTQSINVFNASDNKQEPTLHTAMQTSETEAKPKEPSTPCSHSLHRDHVQYFSYNGIVASFIYTPVEVWEIGLPCMLLDLHAPRLVDTNLVLEEIKNFALRGFEVYAKFQEKLTELSMDAELSSLVTLKQLIVTDQSAFRDKVAIVQTLLTEKNVKPIDINDAMILVKKILADSIEMLSPHFTTASIQNRTMYSVRNEPNSNEIIDSGVICTEELSDPVEDNENNRVLTNQTSSISNYSDLIISNSSDTPTVDTVDIPPQPPLSSSVAKSVTDGQTSSNRDSVISLDKKSVKTKLRELLAPDKNVFVLQSPILPNAHYCLPLGKFPIVVYDNDLSSMIAYALVSDDYRKLLTNLQTGYSSDAAAHSPTPKRRSQDGIVDGVGSGGGAGAGSSSGPDEKDSSNEQRKSSGGNNHKSSMHIEVNFQDSTTLFLCKIYFAREFDAMRSNFIRAPSSSAMKQQSTTTGIPFDRKSSGNSLTTKTITDSVQEFDEIQLAFARSLCQSIPWEARGGKSGSKFCKTFGKLPVVF